MFFKGQHEILHVFFHAITTKPQQKEKRGRSALPKRTKNRQDWHKEKIKAGQVMLY